MEPGYQQQEQPYDLDYGFAGKQPLLPDQDQQQQQQPHLQQQQQPLQQTNGNSDDLFSQLGNNSLLETVNGKHRPKPPKYNDVDEDEEDEEDEEEDDDAEEVEDVDLGPETNVDAVDDAPEDYAKSLGTAAPVIQNYPDEFDENKFTAANGEDDQFSMDQVNKRHQNELLIPESDNVADSEDSEDEWNYYRPEDKSGAKEQEQQDQKPELNSDLVSSGSISQQPSKDPALVEKPDQCEEEKESCSPKPNEDEDYEDEGPEEPEDCFCDNNRASEGPASASAEPEADEPVTAEYDELIQVAEATGHSELKEPDTDVEATIPEDDLPYDQDQPQQLLEQPLQREEPQQQQLEDYRQEDDHFDKRQEELEQKFEEQEPLQREELPQQQQLEDHQQDEPFVKQQEDLEQFEQPLLQVKEEPQQQQLDFEPVQQPDFKTEPQAELLLPEQQLKQSLSDVDDEDMDTPLNPDAAEFVPTAIPPHVSNSDVISGSPLKQPMKHLKSHNIPSEEMFQEEVCHRPSEIDDSMMSDYLNGSRLSGFADENQQTIVANVGLLDDSEVSSTKAEFGDESNFSVASELQKTMNSNMDCSYTCSERGDFDFVKDSMTTSMTPGDFKAAFEQEPDLNKVHELKDEDLAEIQNGSYEEDDEDTKMDVETNNDLSKENIELDFQNFAVQQEQNSEVFSAIVEERESDNKDLFMNQRNIEHDLAQPEVTSTQNTDASNALEEPVYASSNPFTLNYDSNAQFNNDMEKVTDDLHNVELKEQQEQSLFDNDNVLRSDESEVRLRHDERDEVMQNPLSLNFGNASAEEKSNEHVLVSPLKEPEVMSSKFEEEDLMSKSIEGLNQKPSEDQFEQNEALLLGSSEIPVASENATDKPLIENISEESFEKKSINLSESLQEFTGLEKQLCPDQLEIKEDAQQSQEPQMLKENLVEEQKDVEEVTVAPISDIKVEATPSVTNEPSTITNGASETPAEIPVAEVAAGTAVAAGTFAVAAAAAVMATVTPPAKPSTKTAAPKTGKPSTTSKIGSKTTTPTSPTKAGAGPKTGSTAAAATKKTAPTTARTAASKPATGTSTAKTTSSTLSKISSAAPKPPATTATKTRTTTASSATSKTRISAVGSKIGSLPADKKPIANGDIKSTGSKPLPTPRTTTKPATSSTTSKTGLVKSTTSSTARTSTSAVSATVPKAARPASASAAPAAPKTAVSKLGSRNIGSSTNTTAARPKTAPTSTLSSVKSKIGSTAAKSPVTDKQIKETANKQISSARTSTVSSSSVTKTRVSSATSTTSTTTKRLSLASKASATGGSTASPTKKPISKTGPNKITPSKANSKVSSTTKSVTSSAKVVQNGISEEKVTNTTVTTTTTVTAANIEEADIPKKDVSPIEPITDNQLITAE